MAMCFGEICLWGQRPNANGALSGPTGNVHPVRRGTDKVTFVVAVFT